MVFFPSFKNMRKIIKAKPCFPFKSQLEKDIYKIIRKTFPQQKIFINKRGLLKSNKRLELDLYFPEYKIGVEIQGPFHARNEYIILKDYEKQKLFLLEKNIKIIYIYTNTYINKKYSIMTILKIIKNERDKRK